jgi:hypothetical protein
MNAVDEVADRLRDELKWSDAAVAVSGEVISIVSPSSVTGRSIEVQVDRPADITVAFLIPGTRGGPFEAVFTGSPHESNAVVHEVVRLVGDLVAERSVVAYDSRWLRGGRRFLKASDLSSPSRPKVRWVRSWSGSHDWDAA